MQKLEPRLKKHEHKYRRDSWKEYSSHELAGIVAFFAKNATQRTDTKRISKDIRDAENYLLMLKEKLEG